MRYRVIFFMLAFSLSFIGYSQVSLTKKEWESDIDQLLNKISKKFVGNEAIGTSEFESKLETLKSNLENLKHAEIICSIQQSLAALSDGHSGMWLLNAEIGFHLIPMHFYWFGDALRITSTTTEYADYLGNIVTHISGKPINEVLALVNGIVSKDNHQGLLTHGPRYLRAIEILNFLGLSNGETVALTLRDVKASEINKISVPAMTLEELGKSKWISASSAQGSPKPKYLTKLEYAYWYERDELNKIIYFKVNSVRDYKGFKSLKEVTEEVFELVDENRDHKLVIDFRQNEGGNYNLARPIIDNVLARNWLNVEGKVFAVVDRFTYSAASSTTAFLKNETNCLTVGEYPSGTANGSDDTDSIVLKYSKLNISYTVRIKERVPSMKGMQYIPLDIEIPYKFEDYLLGKDMSMEAIKNY